MRNISCRYVWAYMQSTAFLERLEHRGLWNPALLKMAARCVGSTEFPGAWHQKMLRLLPVWFLLCSSFSLPGTVLQGRVWPWVAAVPAEAFCWHTGVLGARLTGTLFKHRKHVCFYSSSLGAWAGILCHFPVLGARFSRKTASPFAAKHSSYWPTNLHLALSGLPLLESSYSLTWVCFDICRCNKQYRDSWSEHSLAAHTCVASWAGLLSSLLVWLHCCVVTL